MSRLAVVVIFQERTAYVDECLRALLSLEAGPWHIVLVPDRRVPEYEGLAVQVPAEGGLSRKRNAGIAACPAGCELIGFVDSDAAPRRDWARRAVEAFGSAGPDIALLTGPNLTPPSDPWSRRACGAALASPLIMGAGARFYAGGGKPVSVSKAFSCNLVARREALAAAGGFDETVKSEDIGLCEAVLRRGGKILYEPELVVHHHRRDFPRFFAQWFNEALSLRDYLRYPGAGTPLAFLPTLLLLGEAGLLLGAGWRTVLILECAMFAAFWAERLSATRQPALAAGAAFAMSGFLKAFGVGGAASFLYRSRSIVPSRCDPPAGIWEAPAVKRP